MLSACLARTRLCSLGSASSWSTRSMGCLGSKRHQGLLPSGTESIVRKHRNNMEQSITGGNGCLKCLNSGISRMFEILWAAGSTAQNSSKVVVSRNSSNPATACTDRHGKLRVLATWDLTLCSTNFSGVAWPSEGTGASGCKRSLQHEKNEGANGHF